MKKVYIISDRSQIIGVYTNLKKAKEQINTILRLIDSNNWYKTIEETEQTYSTITEDKDRYFCQPGTLEYYKIKTYSNITDGTHIDHIALIEKETNNYFDIGERTIII